MSMASHRLSSHRGDAKLQEAVAENRKLEDSVWRLKKAHDEQAVEYSRLTSKHAELLRKMENAGKKLTDDQEELVRLRQTNSVLRSELEEARSTNYYGQMQKLQVSRTLERAAAGPSRCNRCNRRNRCNRCNRCSCWPERT